MSHHIVKHSDTEWELSWTTDNGSGDYREITATTEGLEISSNIIPWSELDQAREAVYKQAQSP